MQPVVGVLADNSRSKWGRRRPFMIGGALIVAVCLLVLGWTGEIVRLFVTEPETVGAEIMIFWVSQLIMATGKIMHDRSGCP